MFDRKNLICNSFVSHFNFERTISYDILYSDYEYCWKYHDCAPLKV